MRWLGAVTIIFILYIVAVTLKPIPCIIVIVKFDWSATIGIPPIQICTPVSIILKIYWMIIASYGREDTQTSMM